VDGDLDEIAGAKRKEEEGCGKSSAQRGEVEPINMPRGGLAYVSNDPAFGDPRRR